GATFTPDWEGCAYLVHATIEPSFAAAVTQSGPNAYKRARIGVLSDGTQGVDLVVKPGQILITDPIAVRGTAAGTAIALRQWTTGIGVPVGRTTIANVDYSNAGAGDISNNTTDLSAGNALGQFGPPLLILGKPTIPVVSAIGIGDSIMFATRDTTGDADGNVGWFERAMAGHPYANFSRSGDTISEMISNSTLARTFRMQAIALARPTIVIVAMGANDFPGTSWATFDGREALLCAELKALGVKYVGTMTSLPQTTSTDAFATTANQTPTAANVMIQQRNTALRAGTQQAAWDFVIDWGTLVESSIGSGLWVPLKTPDGTHPIDAAMNAAMAVVARAKLAAVVPGF
ncbi:MAG: YapH protein, partial [Sphingomonas bacterium]|nr:YapH protein [Sphingomonas bacterium]